MNSYETANYEVRLFTPDEWPYLRDIRLEALQEYPDRLSQPYEQARVYGEQNWRNLIIDPDKATFGIFNEKEVIGYHFVAKWPDKKLAGSNGSYIRRRHNWCGIDILLFASAIDWAKRHCCEQFDASCKENNFASIRLFKKYGGKFAFKSDTDETYPDGSIGRTVHYFLKL